MSGTLLGYTLAEKLRIFFTIPKAGVPSRAWTCCESRLPLDPFRQAPHNFKVALDNAIAPMHREDKGFRAERGGCTSLSSEVHLVG